MVNYLTYVMTGLFIFNLALAEESSTATQPVTESPEVSPAISPAETMPAQTPAAQQAADMEQPGSTAPMPEEQSGFSRGIVKRSVFTNDIQDREPVDNISQVGNSGNRIYYFTELHDMSGQTVRHRWKYGGKLMAEVEFHVRGPRWRVWSSKKLLPTWQGEWKVAVVNMANEVISEETFNYQYVAPADVQPGEPVEQTGQDEMKPMPVKEDPSTQSETEASPGTPPQQ